MSHACLCLATSGRHIARDTQASILVPARVRGLLSVIHALQLFHENSGGGAILLRVFFVDERRRNSTDGLIVILFSS